MWVVFVNYEHVPMFKIVDTMFLIVDDNNVFHSHKENIIIRLILWDHGIISCTKEVVERGK